MTDFLDASAIVKLYVDEFDHQLVRHLSGPLLISQLSRVEVPSALWRKARAGEITADDARTLSGVFEFDYHVGPDGDRRYTVVDVSGQLLEEGAALVARQQLRAFDSVQLACALSTRRHAEPPFTFVTYDRSLGEAARREGLRVAPNRP